MTHKVAILFGDTHNHEKNTQPHWPVVEQLQNELPEVEVYGITSPTKSLTPEGFSSESTRRLQVVGRRLVAETHDGPPLTPDDIALAYDRTGTISSGISFAQCVINHPEIRRLGQGKDDGQARTEILDAMGIPYDFSGTGRATLNGYEEALRSTGARATELRIYHHVVPEVLLSELWVPVVYGRTDDNRPVYRTAVQSNYLSNLAQASRDITRAFAKATGQTDVIAATGWAYRDGVWTVVAPNTGNVQHGATTLNQDPNAHETRRNVGKHLAAIIKRAS